MYKMCRTQLYPNAELRPRMLRQQRYRDFPNRCCRGQHTIQCQRVSFSFHATNRSTRNLVRIQITTVQWLDLNQCTVDGRHLHYVSFNKWHNNFCTASGIFPVYFDCGFLKILASKLWPFHRRRILATLEYLPARCRSRINQRKQKASQLG